MQKFFITLFEHCILKHIYYQKKNTTENTLPSIIYNICNVWDGITEKTFTSIVVERKVVITDHLSELLIGYIKVFHLLEPSENILEV